MPLANGENASSGFDQSPISVSATQTSITSGDLIVDNGGFGVATATSGSAQDLRVNFNLRADDAKFEVLDGTDEAHSILRAQRDDTNGNAVTVGASGNNADLTVHGTIDAGTNTITGNGSTLTNVNAATVDDLNKTANLKFWTGTLLEYQALTPVADTIYNVTDDNNPGTTTYGGPVEMADTLTVGGLASLNGGTTTTTLTASGLASLNGGATVTGNASVSGVSTLTGGIAPNGGETTITGIKFWAGDRDEFQALFNDLSGALDPNTIYNYPGTQITTTT